jgi:hypothetical protein
VRKSREGSDISLTNGLVHILREITLKVNQTRQDVTMNPMTLVDAGSDTLSSEGEGIISSSDNDTNIQKKCTLTEWAIPNPAREYRASPNDGTPRQTH